MVDTRKHTFEISAAFLACFSYISEWLSVMTMGNHWDDHWADGIINGRATTDILQHDLSNPAENTHDIGAHHTSSPQVDLKLFRTCIYIYIYTWVSLIIFETQPVLPLILLGPIIPVLMKSQLVFGWNQHYANAPQSFPSLTKPGEMIAMMTYGDKETTSCSVGFWSHAKKIKLFDVVWPLWIHLSPWTEMIWVYVVKLHILN